MGAPEGNTIRPSRHPFGAYSKRADRRRHHGGLRHGVRRLCALRIPAARGCLSPARRGGAADAGSGLAARPGARRPGCRRRLRNADADRLGQARLLVALHLHRRCHCGRVRAGARAIVAVACRDGDRVQRGMDAAGNGVQLRRGARSARVQRARRFRACRRVPGMRIALRASGQAGRSRPPLEPRARGLPPGRHASCPREPA